MKIGKSFIVTAFCLAFATFCRSEEADKPRVRIELNLTDGSRLLGVPALTSLTFQASFGLLKIPLRLMTDLQMRPGASNALVTLRNGDRLTGLPDLPTIELDTLFGRQSVKLQAIDKITVQQTGFLPASLSASLVLHYPFDRDEQAAVSDESPSKNNGKVVGARFTADGKNDGALQFDGIDDYVDIGNGPSLQLSKDFTLAAWVFLDGTQGGTFISKSDNPDHRTRSVEFYVIPDGAWGGYFFSETGNFFSGFAKGNPIPPGAWQHLVLLHDSSLPTHQMRAYLNGVPVPLSFDYESAAVAPVVLPVSSPVRLGCMGRGQLPFKGRLDDVMIFNRRLSPEDVAQLYRSTR